MSEEIKICILCEKEISEFAYEENAGMCELCAFYDDEFERGEEI